MLMHFIQGFALNPIIMADTGMTESILYFEITMTCKIGEKIPTQHWRPFPGIHTSTWEHMFIETTYEWGTNRPMGCNHILSPEYEANPYFSLSWVESQSIRDLRNSEEDSHHTRHKEEAGVESRRVLLYHNLSDKLCIPCRYIHVSEPYMTIIEQIMFSLR